jgi:hypothetical protein
MYWFKHPPRQPMRGPMQTHWLVRGKKSCWYYNRRCKFVSDDEFKVTISRNLAPQIAGNRDYQSWRELFNLCPNIPLPFTLCTAIFLERRSIKWT